MRRTPFFLLALLAVQLSAEESTEQSDEVATNEIVMQRLGRSLNSMSKTDRVAALEAQMNDVFTGTARGDFGAKAASARPPVDGYRIFTKGDLLLWKEYIGGDDYAFTDSNINSLIVLGTNKHLNFDWSWGARAELGFRFPHDSWDGLVRYTWFRAQASNKMGAPVSGTIHPLYGEYVQGVLSTNLAKAHWKTRLSVIDGEFGKDYFVNRWMSCKPFFGLKTAWINQSMTASYNAYPISYVKSTIKGKNNFWGIGPWAGMNSAVHFTKWLNAFCSFGGSLMTGSFDVTSKNKQGEVQVVDLNQDTTQIVPMAQIALGLGWDMLFNRNRNHFAVRASYELLYWWRQNQLTHYGIGNSFTPPPFGRYAEDLAFHGCTLDLLFDF